MLVEANLEGALLAEAYLDGANLQGANLRNANLLEASITEANLQGATIEGTDLGECFKSRTVMPDCAVKATGSESRNFQIWLTPLLPTGRLYLWNKLIPKPLSLMSLKS